MTTHLGVYVLGAADATERLRVEAHLPGCPDCRAEVAGLTPLHDLLASVPDGLRPAAVSAGRAPQLRRPPLRGAPLRGAPLRRPLWGRSLRAAAIAAAVAVVAGFAAGHWLSPAREGHGQPASVTFSGTNPATRVAATAALTPASWGTSIELRLRGIPMNVECRLVVHSRAGATEVAGVWDAWSKGPVSVPASAGWRTSDIASLQVMTGSTSLVTIQAAGRKGAAPAGHAAAG
jgi:hypothetical protein